MPEIIIYIFVAVIGACIGSFLNVVIYRVPNVITYPLFVLAIVVRIVLPLLPQPYLFSDMRVAPTVYLHMSGYPDWLVSLGGALFGALVGSGSLWLVGAIWKALRGVDAMG